jgi:hypothetical protein
LLGLLFVGLAYILAAAGVLLILYGLLTKAISSGTKHIEEQLKILTDEVKNSELKKNSCLYNSLKIYA